MAPGPDAAGVAATTSSRRAREIVSIADALAGSALVIVTGQAGIGMSHALAGVARELARRGIRVVAGHGADPSDLVGRPEHGQVAVLVDRGDELSHAAATQLDVLVQRGVGVAIATRSLSCLRYDPRPRLRAGTAIVVDLAPLDVPEAAAVLEGMLGGPVDERTAIVLHGRTGGIPAALQATARTLVAAAALVRRGGLWRLAAEPRWAGIDALAAGLDDATRTAVLVVATAEPLPVAVALAVVDEPALEAAEAAHLIRLDERTDTLRLAASLSRDGVLQEHPADALDGLRARIADAWRRGGAADDAAAARIALLGLPVVDRPVGDLLALAERVAASDPPLCARLLDEIAPRCRDDGDRLRLATLLSHQHRSAEAQTQLAAIDLAGLDAQSRLGVAVTRAFLNAMPENRPEAALREIDAAIAEFGAAPLALAVRATALWRSGRYHDATTQAEAVAHGQASPPDARAHALLTLGATSILTGERRIAERAFEEVETMDGVVSTTLPEAVESARLTRISGELDWGLPLDGILAASRAGYDRALAAGDDGVRAHHAYQIAHGLLHTGDAAGAVDRVDRVAELEGIWAPTMASWRAALRARILAAGGRIEDAQEALRELAAMRRPAAFDVYVALAEAAVAAAEGRVAHAVAVLAAAARVEHARGGAGAVAVVRYEAVTYGDAVAARELATAPRGAVSEARLTHAGALVSGDPHALLRAADALSATGHRWNAASAAGAAAVAAAAAGDRGTTRDAWQLLLEATGRLPVPVAAAARGRLLSPRRQAVAGLAASGLDDASIARRLDISPRTVQVHLSAAYAALGAASRHDLAPRLAVLGVGAPPA